MKTELIVVDGKVYKAIENTTASILCKGCAFEGNAHICPGSCVGVVWKELETSPKEKLLIAYFLGKQLQARKRGDNFFVDVTNPLWDWGTYEYRLKPEPRKVRLALFREGANPIAMSPFEYSDTEECSSFIKWVSEEITLDE